MDRWAIKGEKFQNINPSQNNVILFNVMMIKLPENTEHLVVYVCKSFYTSDTTVCLRLPSQ